jgi:hypothetical protein
MELDMRLTVSAILVAVVGCASGGAIPEARFANKPAVTAVNDRKDVRKPPSTRETNMALYNFDAQFFRVMTRKLELPRSQRARGTNALDEVPDSTWFTNRIGVRDLTPEEVAAGTTSIGSPEAHMPWTIKSTKIGGRSVGFVIEDARGEKYILKFDRIDPRGGAHPEVETAANVITNRLLWAFGYNVPEDHVVYFRPEDLVIAKDAEIKDWSGTVGPLDQAALEERLGKVIHEKDGRLRGVASRMIPGKVVGGHPDQGVRSDDPNDRIPHELRRDLRGAFAAFAWLDATDVKEANTIDVWTEDPADKGHHYLKHYFIDFGGSLGATTSFKGDPRVGTEYRYDFGAAFDSLASLGSSERTWDDRKAPGLRGVGTIQADLDPDKWKPETPAYLPFRTADRFDKFWGAKILIRFTRDQIRAAVEAGRLSDPAATDYLVDVLVARQRTTARYWFSRVNPLDRFAVDDADGVCFDDLLLTHDLARPGETTTYRVKTHDRKGRALAGGDRELAATADGRSCTGALELAPGDDGYTIVSVETLRPRPIGSTFVHVARDPATGAPRVIGVWRK